MTMPKPSAAKSTAAAAVGGRVVDNQFLMVPEHGEQSDTSGVPSRPTPPCGSVKRRTKTNQHSLCLVVTVAYEIIG